MNPPFTIRTTKLKDGRVAYDLDFCFKGKRWRPRLGHDLSLDEAHRIAWQAVKAIQSPPKRGERLGVAPVTGRDTVALADLLPLYWQEFDLNQRIHHARPRTIINKHLLRIFRDKPLAAYTYADGVEYQVIRQGEGASAGTLRNEWSLLLRLLNLAVQLDWLDKNRLARCPRPVAPRRTRVATMDELLTLQAQTSQPLWHFILVALGTGLRRTMILNLERDWLSGDGRWLLLPPPRSRSKGHPRKVPVSSLVAEALAGEGTIWPWVPSGLEKAWKAATMRAGIVDLHLHDLRHTFATRLQNLGVGYEVRQALLGHAMPGMTQSYSHGGAAWEAQLQHAIEALDVDYRSHGLVSRSVSWQDHDKKVVGLDYYKAVKAKENIWHAPKGLAGWHHSTETDEDEENQ